MNVGTLRSKLIDSFCDNEIVILDKNGKIVPNAKIAISPRWNGIICTDYHIIEEIVTPNEKIEVEHFHKLLALKDIFEVSGSMPPESQRGKRK